MSTCTIYRAWGSLGRPWDLIFDYHVYIGEGGEKTLVHESSGLEGGLEGLGGALGGWVGPLRSFAEALGLEFE